MHRSGIVALAIGIGFALLGCGSEREIEERADEPAAPAAAELRIDEIAIGDGPVCESPSEVVSIHYRGSLLDGHVFDSSYERGEPIVAPLDSLIAGWQQGIPGMRVGGKRRLTVPADLAYSGMAAVQAVEPGARGAGEVLIPPGSTLVFEIELLSLGSGDGSAEPSEVADRGRD